LSACKGNIVEVQRQKQNINTLDRYIVVFAWGEKQVFSYYGVNPSLLEKDHKGIA